MLANPRECRALRSKTIQTDARECPRMPANVRECPRMVCTRRPRIPANARERPRMPANARECPTQGAHECPRKPANPREWSSQAARECPRRPANAREGPRILSPKTPTNITYNQKNDTTSPRCLGSLPTCGISTERCKILKFCKKRLLELCFQTISTIKCAM